MITDKQTEVNTLENNNDLIFSPQYLIYQLKVQNDYGLSDLETKVYSFVLYFLSDPSKRFYFTNEQIGKIFNVNDYSISRVFSRLKQLKLLDFEYKTKANGGKVRFVSLPDNKNEKADLTKKSIQTCGKSQTKENNINNIYIYAEKMANEVKEYINKICNRNFKVLDNKTIQNCKSLIKNNISLEEIYIAIDEAAKDKYHKETKYKYLTPEFITRADKFNRFYTDKLKVKTELIGVDENGIIYDATVNGYF
jgi:uncharacterized phage protein (TIGR02220 family)